MTALLRAELLKLRTTRTFAAVVASDRVMGAQFHPERSAGFGAQVLRNFLSFQAARAAGPVAA